MPFDVKALLRNKPALYGLGAAAVVGGYVLYKRKQSTGSTSASSPAPGATTYSTTGTGYPNTTGTDLVQQWGQYSGGLQSQLDAFLQQLSNTQTGAGNIPPAPTPSPAPTPTPTPAPITGGPKVGHTTVIDGKNLTELLNAFGMTAGQFEQLNPGIQSTYHAYIAGRGYVSAGTPGSVTALNVGSSPKVVNVYGGW